MTITAGLLLAFLLTVLVGVSLGSLGGGGSLLTLPILVHLAGVQPHAAVEMSIVIVGLTSLAGALLHVRQRIFHGKAVVFFATAGGVGALAGSQLTHRMSGPILMLLFAGLLFVVGIAMIRSKETLCETDKCRPVRCLFAGTLVGFLTGFLGVGGGFLIVPALVVMAGIETRKAVGSSLAIIALNSASGFAGHLGHASLDARLTAAFVALALGGMAAGLKLAGRLSGEKLRRIFAWLVLFMAVVIAALNVHHVSWG